MNKNVFANIRIQQWHCQIQRRQLSPFVMHVKNDIQHNTGSYI